MNASIWTDVVDRLGLEEPSKKPLPTPLGQRRRRDYSPATDDGRAMVQLTRDDEGLLRWIYTAPQLASRSGRRSYRANHVGAANVLNAFRFNEFGSNEITTRLVDLDRRLTPGRGMKRWVGGQFVDDPHPQVKKGRVLLLVHGTFSKSDMWRDELGATQDGRDLLAQWASRYTQILAFNHHTLSVGAWSNAIDLNRALCGVDVPIDVVCHSRGGLVVAWLLRMEAVKIEHAVFVGSPLVGTSLAAPDRLRAALDMLANYADLASALGGAASALFPLAAGVAGLAKILGKTLRLGSGLPLVDAAVNLVPGLATQQAVANNLDLDQLFADDWRCRPEMSGIGASFLPAESQQPLWKFWRRFTKIGDQLKFGAADLVFPGDNDLVVDVDSMFRLGEKADLAFERLPPGPTTHHTNYFRDDRVLAHLRRRLV